MTQAKFAGSCLCGSVQYEITGEPNRFYHCHCSRCRKASGTGHASNLIVKLGAVRWTAGEELIGGYKVPEAERFGTRFCTQCGSPLPRVNKDAGVAIIPAGSLDSEPPLAPQARIFWDSRASWSCSGDDLPVYPEYPAAQ
jgi:hypothetical protein